MSLNALRGGVNYPPLRALWAKRLEESLGAEGAEGA